MATKNVQGYQIHNTKPKMYNNINITVTRLNNGWSPYVQITISGTIKLNGSASYYTVPPSGRGLGFSTTTGFGNQHGNYYNIKYNSATQINESWQEYWPSGNLNIYSHCQFEHSVYGCDAGYDDVLLATFTLGEVPYYTQPDVPSNLRVETKHSNGIVENANEEFTLRFNPVSGNVMYELEIKTYNQDWYNPRPGYGTSVPYIIVSGTSIPRGTYMYFRVRAWNRESGVYSNYSNEAQMYYQPIHAELSLKSSSLDSITLNWKGKGIYDAVKASKLYYYVAEKSKEWISRTVNASSGTLTISDLKPATEYVIKVKLDAYDNEDHRVVDTRSITVKTKEPITTVSTYSKGVGSYTLKAYCELPLNTVDYKVKDVNNIYQTGHIFSPLDTSRNEAIFTIKNLTPNKEYTVDVCFTLANYGVQIVKTFKFKTEPMAVIKSLDYPESAVLPKDAWDIDRPLDVIVKLPDADPAPIVYTLNIVYNGILIVSRTSLTQADFSDSKYVYELLSSEIAYMYKNFDLSKNPEVALHLITFEYGRELGISMYQDIKLKTDTNAWVKPGNEWKKAKVWVKANGTWKTTRPWVKVKNNWTLT